MKLGVLKYPGGHGEHELIYVIRHIFGNEVQLVWYKDPELAEMDVIFLGGGFPCLENPRSYDCVSESPLLQILRDLASENRSIIGIGNGFQVLCEAGLLEGTLVKNPSEKFICKQIYLKAENQTTPITRALDPEEIFKMPIATYLGKYVAEEEILVDMRQSGQIIFRFCDYEGRITEAVNYTDSTENIAGICNAQKNVFGIIPRPERSAAEFRADPDQKDILGSFINEILQLDDPV